MSTPKPPFDQPKAACWRKPITTTSGISSVRVLVWANDKICVYTQSKFPMHLTIIAED